MEKASMRNLVHYLKRYGFIMLMLAPSLAALADVGNQNRYSSDAGSGGDDDISGLVGFLLGLLVDSPSLGVAAIIIVLIIYLVYRRKHGRGKTQFSEASAGTNVPPPSYSDTVAVASQIQAIDPNFSAEKFTAWVREVFLKLQQAWTEQNWKLIRPFESEELFSLHNSQLDEYIRSGKINVVEKVGIKACELVSFTEDGDKEVLKVSLNAVMRDYVIDAKTRKVLESDPNRDWYMNYEMTFNRKKGVKTQEGLSNKSTTNCPNCGAPTEITSAGQCEYCGSVITTGEHDWVLSDIHSL